MTRPLILLLLTLLPAAQAAKPAPPAKALAPELLSILTSAIEATGQVADADVKSETLRRVGWDISVAGNTGSGNVIRAAALTVAIGMANPREGIEEMSQLVAEHAHFGNEAEARRIVELIEQRARTVPDPVKSSVLELLARAQAATRDFEAAGRTAERLDKGYGKDSTLAEIARAQADADQPDAARRTLDGVQDRMLKGHALANLAAAYARAGAIDKAMGAADAIADRYAKAIALVGVAGGQFTSGDRTGALESLRRAREVARTIDDWYWAQDARYRVVVALTNVDLPSADSDAEAITSTLKQLHAVCAVAVAHAGNGNAREARAWLAKASGLRHAPFNQDQDTMAWLLGTAQALVGDAAAAARTAEAIQERRPRISVLAQSARTHAEAGNVASAREAVHEAMRFAAAAESPHVRATLLSSIYRILVDSNRRWEFDQ